jgi:hypothetical protein
MNEIVDRVRALQTMATRATPAPLLVRCTIFLGTLVSFAMAYPLGVFSGRALGLLVIAAVLPAVAPRGAFPTLAALVAVGGWLLSTVWYGEPVALWRLLGLAGALYLMHNLCALAAVLPYDAVVAPEALAGWILRALAVVLASAVLAILLLDLADWSGGRTYVGAAVAGLAVAVGAAALLGWLLRRK